jgi:hypothetical protein
LFLHQEKNANIIRKPAIDVKERDRERTMERGK